MITTANIYVAIKQRLETVFNNVQIKDIKTITAPCFYIQYVNSEDSEVANDTTQCRASYNVVYFAEERELSELLSKEETLKTNFKKPLKIGNRFILPTIDFDIDEGEEYTLSMGISFDFYQDNEITNPYDEELNNTLMENLVVTKAQGH